MGVRLSILTIALATLGSFLHPSTASAITLQYLSSNTQSNRLLNAPVFVAIKNPVKVVSEKPV